MSAAWLCLLAVLAAPTAQAGEAAPAAAPPLEAPAKGEAPADEYRVGIGDVLEVAVFGNEDLSRAATVQTNGTITLPLLGEVTVHEMSVGEIKRKLTALLERDYLVNPQVEVKVREYQSRFVTVLGEVGAPGRKALRGRTRLIDVLVEAGGFTPRASGEVVVTRAEGALPGGATSLRLRLSSGAPTEQDRVALELLLRHGDIVTAAPKFYVTVDGEVQQPGRYVVESDLTVTGAISSAGGLTRFGSNNVKVRRTRTETGQPEILEVDLKAVRAGKEPDLALLPNDVVSVPRRLF
jgi:polysaccharide export outer membrane protein